MQNNYLSHYGTKGMKWGVRRYQNKDGTLTKKGMERYERDIRENDAKKKDSRIKISGPDPNRWVREDLERTKSTVDASSGILKQIDSANNSIPKKSAKKVDLSSMSDAELRAKINRAQLEKQYNDLFSHEEKTKADRGREVVSDVLKYGGAALGVTGSAVNLAIAVKKLKG